jgi:DNA-binding transcriptional ArsR family regulator
MGVVSDPLRWMILDLLYTRSGEVNVQEVADLLDRRASNVSQHLGLLRRYGLVQAKRQGQAVYYSLTNPAAWAKLREVITAWGDDQNWFRGRGAGINSPGRVNAPRP